MTEFPGHEDVGVRVQKGREEYQKFHGEAPPVNPGEASNGMVRVGDDYDVHSKEWRDHEGVKTPNPADSVNSCVAESPHTYDSENDWQQYDPSEDFVTDEQYIGHAADVFERMTGVEEEPLESKPMTDGGRVRDVSERSYEPIADGGVSNMPIGGMAGTVPVKDETETDYHMGDIT